MEKNSPPAFYLLAELFASVRLCVCVCDCTQVLGQRVFVHGDPRRGLRGVGLPGRTLVPAGQPPGSHRDDVHRHTAGVHSGEDKSNDVLGSFGARTRNELTCQFSCSAHFLC